MLYLGVDVSKLKLDCSLTKEGEHIISRKVVSNNEVGFRELLDWANRYAKKVSETSFHMGMEATGIYSEAAFHYFSDNNFPVSVLNPAQVKFFSKSLLLRTKTDKVDADLIACYTFRMNPRISLPAPKELRQLKQYVHHLNYLTKQKAEMKSRVESCRNSVIEHSMTMLISSLDSQISETKSNIKKLLKMHAWLSSKAQLLESIPGIGEMTAWMLISELLGISNEQKISRKQQVAHSGLAPSFRVSGTSVHGQSRICGKGNVLLRRCLYMPTLSSITHNPQIGLFYQRLVEKGKKKKVAITACMKKLLCIAIGVLNNETPYDENWISIKPNYA